MCEAIGNRLTTIAQISLNIAKCAIGGPLDSVIKIGATVASIFECVIPKNINERINEYAREGLFQLVNEEVSFALLPSFAYNLLLDLIPGYKTFDTKHSLSFKLQDKLFTLAHTLRDANKHNAITNEVGARLAFFGATLLVLIAKVGQLALGILAAAISLVTLNGFFGCCNLQTLNTFAYSNLYADLLETLCDGLRYTFHPDRAKANSYFDFSILTPTTA